MRFQTHLTALAMRLAPTNTTSTTFPCTSNSNPIATSVSQTKCEALLPPYEEYTGCSRATSSQTTPVATGNTISRLRWRHHERTHNTSSPSPTHAPIPSRPRSPSRPAQSSPTQPSCGLTLPLRTHPRRSQTPSTPPPRRPNPPLHTHPESSRPTPLPNPIPHPRFIPTHAPNRTRPQPHTTPSNALACSAHRNSGSHVRMRRGANETERGWGGSLSGKGEEAGDVWVGRRDRRCVKRRKEGSGV